MKAIAIQERATSDSVHKALPHLKPQQIQKAIYQLLSQDRILKDGQSQRTGKKGRPMFFYVANEDWEPANRRSDKQSAAKSGRKNHHEALRSDGGTTMLPIARFRDRKIRLLTRLVQSVQGTDRDLLIGILADYGYRYEGVAPAATNVGELKQVRTS
ncbi:MAG TPA: hypothetical protein VJ998_10100 [Pseudomonadales bacterium]|nr:hypothetical protein [Pseudomonadales bacterium]